MEYLNQRWFDRHDALLIARGASAGAATVGPDGQVVEWKYNGGITSPLRVVLAVGTRMVRFGGTSGDGSRGASLPHLAVRGGWWLEFGEYRRVEAYADRLGIPVSVAVRLLCCVPLEWSAMDMVVQVRLNAALLAYAGTGAPALVPDSQGGTAEYLDGLDDASAPRITQLYIPGLGSGDIQHDAILLVGYGHLPPEQSRLGYVARTSR